MLSDEYIENRAKRFDFMTKHNRTFDVSVQAEVEKYTSFGIEHHVKLKLVFWDEQYSIITVPLSEIDHIDWFEKDKRCVLKFAKAAIDLPTQIKLALNDAPKEKMLRLDHTGIYDINGNIVYVAGDKVIGSLPDKDNWPKNATIHGIERVPLPFKLDIDTSLTKQQVFEGMRKLICLSSEIGRPLIAHAISGITRAAYKAAGMTPCAVLVIVAKSGKLKTYYCPHMTQLCNRSISIGPVSRLNSTTRFIEDILYEFSECTSVVDDLHTAESAK